MAGSAAGDGTTYEQLKLMAVTGTGDLNDSKAEVQFYPVGKNTTYHLIDRAGKLIANDILSESSALGLPDDWTSPLVSAYHYYKTATITDGTYTLSDPISSPFDATDGIIYVNYDVNNEIDLTGGKTYLLRYLHGESFRQENGSDGINGTETKAVYPYNNGDFHLYVYGQEQWDTQLSSGASTRSRWLWKFISRHNGVDLTGNNIDPYHVVVKSYQNQTVKDKKDNLDYNFSGNTYLRTYKPEGYASVVTGTSYESAAYYADYPGKMNDGDGNNYVNDQPTEYMIVGGSSTSSMMLKTVNPVDGSRRIVDTFEQY